MDYKDGMEIPTDVESLRAALKAMARKDVLKLCARAGVSASTIQKFRAGLIDEPGASKVLALIAAIAQTPTPRASRKKAAA
jgi:predicted transcriptional regulator